MSDDGRDDPFYVGYHPVAPAAIARAVRLITAGLSFAAAVAVILVALAQDPAGPGVFEFGSTRDYLGQLRTAPYPMLLAPAPTSDDRPGYVRYLLAGAGKHGAPGISDSLNGQWVVLHGTRIARESREMIELSEGGIKPAPPAENVRLGIPVPPAVSQGRMTLSGEIVDSKCWLGVMKPAVRTVHRSCASRCLSGGIPPLLMLQDSTGRTVHILLTDSRGEPAHHEFMKYAGRDVTLTGEVIEEGDLLVMRVEEVE